MCLTSTAKEENKIYPNTNMKTRQKSLEVSTGESTDLFINCYIVDANKDYGA